MRLGELASLQAWSAVPCTVVWTWLKRSAPCCDDTLPWRNWFASGCFSVVCWRQALPWLPVRLTSSPAVARVQEGMEKGEDQSLDDGSGSGTQQSGGSESSGAPCGEEYTFTDGEAQLLRICIDAMHTAGLAFIVQGISTMLLGEHRLTPPQACGDVAGHVLHQTVYAYQ